MFVSSRTTNILLVLVLAVGTGMLAMLASGARGGALDPVGTPGPTLPQVEPRSPIPPVGWNGTFPIVIDQPGSYFLTRDLTVPAGGASGISITAPNSVEIDLNGFTLSSPEPTGTGILSTHLQSYGIRIRNGYIVRFSKGIDLSGSLHAVRDITVLGTAEFAIRAGTTATRIERCTVSNHNGDGIKAGIWGSVRDCDMNLVNGDGIDAGAQTTVERNTITGAGAFAGKYGIRVSGTGVLIRDNHLDNGQRDIGVGAHGAMIINNVIHCYTSIVNLGAFSYVAPVDGEEHTNEEKYAAGFC